MRSLEPVSGEIVGWNTDDKTKRCPSLWDRVNLIGRAGRVIDLRAAESISQRAAKSSGVPCFHRFLAKSRERTRRFGRNRATPCNRSKGSRRGPFRSQQGVARPCIGIPK